MSTRKFGTYRPKASSLESLAISRGIIESPASNHPLIERLRRDLCARGTDGSGFSDLMRRFNVLDRDGSKTLNLDEFKIAFQRCNLNFNDQEISTLFYFFDNSDKNYIDYEEVLLALRGPVNHFRRELMEKAFQQIDINGECVVTPEDLIGRFDPSQHPDVKNGTKKAQEVFREFLKSFEVGGEVEGKITKNEFFSYYYNVSASIDRDEYFEILIRNSWHFSGLESWNSSAANPRRSRHGGSVQGPDYYEDSRADHGHQDRERHGGRSDGSYGTAPVYGPRASYDRVSPRSSPNRPMSPGRASSPPPASYYQGRTDRPLNF